MSHLIVTGAADPSPDPSGAPPVIPTRLNILDLMKDDKQWSLYIQALIQLQNTDSNDPLSWFSVSAIHGYPPERQWQGSPGKQDGQYCSHGVPTFPTWHRPYLALFETALQNAAVQIAGQYTTDQDLWKMTALTLRAPFWDWGLPATYIPPAQVYDSVNQANLVIVTANGPQSVRNPLLTYTFQNGEQIEDNYFDQFSQTVRHPQSPPDQPASDADFAQELSNTARSGDLHYDVWKMLNLTESWSAFSNDGVTRGAKANSIETLHNWIHNRTGGGGHMSDTISAGFDPLFMLHHCNVDRQLALWQALHFSVWIDEKSEPDFATAPLYPFWNAEATFHTSVSPAVRNPTQLGSTYPEFAGTRGLAPEEVRNKIQKIVDDLYDPNGRRHGIAVGVSNRVPVPQTEPVASSLLPNPASVPQALMSVSDTTENEHAGSDHLTALQRLDWFARIRTKKFQVGQSFTVLLFLGPIGENPAEWRRSSNYIGSHTIFANSKPGSCKNCMDNLDMINEGYITMDYTLERFGFANKTEEEIEAFIREHIHWRIQKIDGTVLDAADLDVLEVAVMTWDVSRGDLSLRPVHRDVTRGKVGGRVPEHKKYILSA